MMTTEANGVTATEHTCWRRSRLLKSSILAALLLALVLSLTTGCGSQRTNVSDLLGLWEGKLEYPGLELRIAFRITEAEDNQLQAVLLRPDQTDEAVEATKVVLDGSHLRMEFKDLPAFFEGDFDQKSKQIEGEWTQGERTLTTTLASVKEVSHLARPQTPIPPYPYIEEDVGFVNENAGAHLAGTLTLPNDAERVPAVVLISGAGAQDRDGTILAHRPFRVIADYLTRRGVAVLRYDDRGVGASTGDRMQATSANYADDALAGVEFLRNYPGIDPHKVGLLGHSEGGTIAMLAAAASPSVAFIVMLGTPGLPGMEYNLQFEESTGRALGQDDEQLAAKRAFQERVLKVVSSATDLEKARRQLQGIYSEIPGVSDAQVSATIDHILSPWFRFNLSFDPSKTLQQVHCPVLAIFGELDVQVPPEGNLEAIRAALEMAGNPSYRVVKMPQLNHFFQTAETGSPLEYGEIEETISAQVLELLYDWIREQTGSDG